MLSESDLYQELRERLSMEKLFLTDKPEENLDSTLSALWHAAAGQPLSAELAPAKALPQLQAQQESILFQLIEQRLSGRPLAHLTARQHFMNLEMLASPMALIPRKETELLGWTALKLAQELAGEKKPVTIIDVCTGSGNLALAMAHHLPESRVLASDLSESAIEFARLSANHLGLGLGVEFRCGDLMEPFNNPEFLGQVDLLICNPPYITSAKVGQMPSEISAHEPKLAFDGGPFGVAILMRLIQEAPSYLRQGGWLAFEVGLGQGAALVKRLEKNPDFSEVRAIVDSSGDIRAITARH